MGKKFLIIIVIFNLLVVSGCVSRGTSAKNDFLEYNIISGSSILSQSEDDYLVYFYKPDCPYCAKFNPILKEYEKETDALPLYKVNLGLEAEAETWDVMGIQGTPTLMRIKLVDGAKKVADHYLGLMQLEGIPRKGSE